MPEAGAIPPARSDVAIGWFQCGTDERRVEMRGILLWALGIPIPIIIVLYLFHVI